MSRKNVKAGEPQAVTVKPEETYNVEVLRPFDAGGLKLLPRHVNVRLRGDIVLKHQTAVKVLGVARKEG